MVLNRQRIEQLASQYPDVEGRNHYNKEEELLQTFPEKFENGEWGKNDLLDIMHWMRPALKRHFSENSSEHIQEVLEQVRNTTDVEEKVDILDSELYGVGIKAASGILLFMSPEEFAVMTEPSLESLRDEGYTAPPVSRTYSASDYVQYLDTCRTIASQENVSLRKLDRALVVASDS